MEDRQIIELYWQKNADAISETSSKYGAYCFTIADHILNNAEDSEECVNDTWLHAWNAMPPQKPNVLRMFLAKITRNLSVNRLPSARFLSMNWYTGSSAGERWRITLITRNSVLRREEEPRLEMLAQAYSMLG